MNQIINDLEVFYNLNIYLSDDYKIVNFITSSDHLQKAKTNKISAQEQTYLEALWSIDNSFQIDTSFNRLNL